MQFCAKFLLVITHRNTLQTKKKDNNVSVLVHVKTIPKLLYNMKILFSRTYILNISADLIPSDNYFPGYALYICTVNLSIIITMGGIKLHLSNICKYIALVYRLS